MAAGRPPRRRSPDHQAAGGVLRGGAGQDPPARYQGPQAHRLVRLPTQKVAFLERTPTWCRRQATELGEAVARLVGELLAGNALHHLRAAQGVLRLGDRYGPQRLDAACARALACGDPSYRTVKGILAAELDTAPLAAQPATARAVPALLRGAAALVGDLPTSMPAAHHDDPEGAAQ